MEIEDKQENFKFAKGYKTHHLSLYCKIIDQKTKPRPWRLNPYNTPIPEWNKVIFPD
jgi:CRISPR/Cas system-associated protein endoribonuclease Cas2